MRVCEICEKPSNVRKCSECEERSIRMKKEINKRLQTKIRRNEK